MIRIGIFGSGKNVEKLARLLSENLKDRNGVIVEVLLPENRGLFGYDETSVLDSISQNNLDIFEKNNSKIQNFMDSHRNVRMYKDVKITEYFEVNNKHIITMYVENEIDEAIQQEYDAFVFADKLFTIRSTLNGISADHSLANIASINEINKIERLFTKTRAWVDAESIVLVGNDLKTFNFAISLRKTFPDLKITIINVDRQNMKPLRDRTFDYVGESLVNKARLMNIKVYLNIKIVERSINFDTDLVSSITIRDLTVNEDFEIDSEIILVIDNISEDDMLLENSYLLTKLSKLSEAEKYPFINVDEQFEIRNVDNFYFVNFLTYKLVSLNIYNLNQERWYKQWYELKSSYTHIFAVVSSIVSRITPRNKRIVIPVNNDVLSLDNTSLRIEGVIGNNLKNKVLFENGGNNIDLFKNKNIVPIKTGVLAKGEARINLVLFTDKRSSQLKNFLLETKMVNFDPKDSEEVYNLKMKSVEHIHNEIVTFLQSFKLSKINVIDILIKMIDKFDEKYLYKISNLIFEAKRKLARTVSHTKLEETSLDRNIYLDEYSESVIEELPAFKFEETTIIDKKILSEIMSRMEED